MDIRLPRSSRRQPRFTGYVVHSRFSEMRDESSGVAVDTGRDRQGGGC